MHFWIHRTHVLLTYFNSISQILMFWLNIFFTTIQRYIPITQTRLVKREASYIPEYHCIYLTLQTYSNNNHCSERLVVSMCSDPRAGNGGMSPSSCVTFGLSVFTKSNTNCTAWCAKKVNRQVAFFGSVLFFLLWQPLLGKYKNHQMVLVVKEIIVLFDYWLILLSSWSGIMYKKAPR